MSARLLKLNNNFPQSFSVRNDKIPQLHGQPHFHSEVELIYFKNGSGFQCIGDYVGQFGKGDMVLIGENLPHYWVYNESAIASSSNGEALVIHFKKDFLGTEFLKLPEVAPVAALILSASRGHNVRLASVAGPAEHTYRISCHA